MAKYVKGGGGIHAEVVAKVLTLRYNFKNRIGMLDLERGNVPDMDGTIGVFTRLDPKVREILVTAGSELKNQYTLVEGTWRSGRPLFVKRGKQTLMVDQTRYCQAGGLKFDE